MSSIQALVDAINEAGRNTRSDYHMTLESAVNRASQFPGEKIVVFENGRGPVKEMSYRGYYSDLAFSTGAPPTVAEFLARCQAAIGKTYEGYKGGDFTMEESTPLWRAEYGSMGEAIIDAVRDADGNMLLICKQID